MMSEKDFSSLFTQYPGFVSNSEDNTSGSQNLMRQFTSIQPVPYIVDIGKIYTRSDSADTAHPTSFKMLPGTLLKHLNTPPRR
jgi:hypothetical protein